MKKTYIDPEWNMIVEEDNELLFLIIVEQAIPTSSYIYQYSIDDLLIKRAFKDLTAQLEETGTLNTIKVSLVSLPNTEQVQRLIELADTEHKGNTYRAIEAVDELLSRADCDVLEVFQKTAEEKALIEDMQLDEKKKRKKKKQPWPYNSKTYTTGWIGLNIDAFNRHAGTDCGVHCPAGDPGPMGGQSGEAEGDVGDGSSGEAAVGGEGMGEAMKLKEGKRYKKPRLIKRYYIRPQNIFCSTKYDILKALVTDVGDNNCSVYSLKSLDDHNDVHLLKPSDIIYYYDDGILYDKNHVKVMDYDLNVKHEEDRRKMNVNSVSDATFDKNYEDRLTEAFDLDFSCVICGEPLGDDSYSAKPLYTTGKCCWACYKKFVLPTTEE